jgi:hypothetical protein
LAKKTKLDLLKGNVNAQESRLRAALDSLRIARVQSVEDSSSLNEPPLSQSPQSSWDMLERIVGLEEDLLTSYREYTRELEKHLKKEEDAKPQPGKEGLSGQKKAT